MISAIYVRTSTSDKQDTQMQIDELKAYCAYNKLQIVKIFEDKGFTGKNMKRPALKELLSSLPEYECILIWRFDRLARSLKELLFMISEIDNSGVKLVSLKDNIDMATPQGRLMMHIIGAFGQFEADIIKQRVQAGVDHAKAFGTKSGRAFGRVRLRNDALIQQTYALNKSYRKTARMLNIPISTVARSVKSI